MAYDWKKDYAKQRQADYRKRNPDRAKASLEKYRAENREEINRKAAERARKRRALMPEADREYQRKWREANPDKVKANSLRKRHGLEPSDVEAMLASQGGVCAICKQVGKRWVVDHCHATEKRRGILCDPCNIMLGGARDTPEILMAAVKYLKA